MIGGRHLGGGGRGPGSNQGRRSTAAPSRAVRNRSGVLPEVRAARAGTLAGDGRYAQLTVAAASTQAGAPAPRVALEQFNVQAPDVVQFGFDEGWHEPEYNPRTARCGGG